jgi:4-amino-4-deoxy-L-arabinose transferase-like glycosyltransferase
VFLALLAAGAALRVVTFLAYWPALLYQDSQGYLGNAAELVPYSRWPVVYPVFLRVLPLSQGLEVVALVQHLLALLLAGGLYALLLRLGLRPWLAALATAPLLLDAFQLLIEQYVMTETLFDLLIVGACALLLWRRPIPLSFVALAGLLLALAALTRVVAVLVIVPAVVTVAVAGARPSRWVAGAALIAAFAVPLGGYAVWYHAHHGEYSLVGPSGRFLYARVAAFVDCRVVSVSPAERPLCPDEPVGERPSSQDFAWSATSPLYRVPEREREALTSDFARRAIREQPLAYARTVLADVVHGFAVKRTVPRRRVPFEDVWTFQPTFPRREQADPVIRAYGGAGGSVQPQLVDVLRGYQRIAFTPGPLLAAGLLLGLAAAAGIGRARRSALRPAALLFASLGLALYLGPALTQQLMPRYTLPALVLLAPALAVAVTALTGTERGHGAATHRDPSRPLP